jgi:hypothetical protein
MAIKWEEFYTGKVSCLNEEASVEQSEQALQRLWNAYTRSHGGGDPKQVFRQFLTDFEAASQEYFYPGGGDYAAAELAGLEPEWLKAVDLYGIDDADRVAPSM